jgi:hypothetical protein
MQFGQYSGRKDVAGVSLPLSNKARKSMDARFHRVAKRFAVLAFLLLVSMGAQQRTANFVVTTADPNFARQVAQAAEQYRNDLAIEWLGKAMPNWSRPCEMTVQVGGGAGGATTFVFDRGEVFQWQMNIQGSQQRILDSVLPHEITHMIYASHFRQPLPRWADEGGATSVEDASDRNKHRVMLDQFLRTGRGIAFSQMFVMTEYPSDIMPLYAQGYSLAEYLIQNGGRRKYIEFLGDGLQNNDWSGAIQRHYSVQNLAALQNTWLAWVRQGSPLHQQPAAPQPNILLASDQRRARPQPNLIHHERDKQSAPTPLAALVPVGAVPARKTVPAVKWLAPTSSAVAASSSSGPMAQNDSKTTTLSAPGWHVPGSPAPEVAAVPTQVAHPQPLESPRQTILR